MPKLSASLVLGLAVVLATPSSADAQRVKTKHVSEGAKTKLQIANKSASHVNGKKRKVPLATLAKKFANRQSLEKRFDLKTWNTNNFSIPQKGVAKDYVFMVTALSGTSVAKSLSSKNGISKRSLVFASIISDKDNKSISFGHAGLILGVKPSNVIGTSATDTAFGFDSTYNSLMKMSTSKVTQYIKDKYPPDPTSQHPGPKPVRPHVLISPAEMLAKTNPEKKALYYKNNEILLVGKSPSGDKIEPTGIFIRTKNGKDLINAAELKTYNEASKRLNIPIVRLPIAVPE